MQAAQEMDEVFHAPQDDNPFCFQVYDGKQLFFVDLGDDIPYCSCMFLQVRACHVPALRVVGTYTK